MRDLLNLIRWLLLALVRSRTSLRQENLALRHQLDVLHRSSPTRAVFSNLDRLIFVANLGREARECRSQAAEPADYDCKVGWLQLAAKSQSMAAEAHPPGQQRSSRNWKSEG